MKRIFFGLIAAVFAFGSLSALAQAQQSLVINMKTAKALGFTIPQSLLVQADEVIR